MRNFLLIALVLTLFAAPAFGANPEAVTGPDNLVGGVPICITGTGTSAATAVDVDVTLPPGFKPSYIKFWDDIDDLVVVLHYEWIYGMGDGAILHDDGAETLYESSAGSECWFDLSTAGTMTIDAACQKDSDGYAWRACRFSQ